MIWVKVRRMEHDNDWARAAVKAMLERVLRALVEQLRDVGRLA